MSYLSPRMKARMNELGLHAADLAGIAGSGAAGRVTIEDFEEFLAHLDEHKQTTASSMRVAVADAMRRSWTRPLATVGRPVSARRPARAPQAAIRQTRPRALRTRAPWPSRSAKTARPPAGSSARRSCIPKAIDVGFAVESGGRRARAGAAQRRHARRSRSSLPRYNELVELARQRRLPASAQGGSIATVTNFGTFGLTWATPIPLPEQTLVLGLGAGRSCRIGIRTKSQFVPVDRSRPHAQLRPPRARRRRRRPPARTHRRASAKARDAVMKRGGVQTGSNGRRSSNLH